MKTYRKRIKLTAWMLLAVLSFELVKPATALALTTGPTQPEVLSFEPVGTTDMVDMFSGDFVYNIPLLDVEGYPVNIAYHGGINMEQEASWVGLGWNINPGEINRSVRGLPDDFNGEKIDKHLHIKNDSTIRMGIGGGIEFFGEGDPIPIIAMLYTAAGLDAPGTRGNELGSLDLGLYINANNYRGVSTDINIGAGINFSPSISAGVNIGVGSQSGAEIGYNIRAQTADILSKDGGMGIGISQGYSSRTGLSSLNFSANVNQKINVKSGGKISLNQQLEGSIPIGLQNYVPVITNSATMSSITGRIKLGFEFTYTLPYAKGNAMRTVIQYNDDGSRPGYGYLYLQNAQRDHNDYTSILDFTRDRDGMFNKTMKYLPMSNMTYDVFNVSGQGTGGMFRPFRNDYGSVYDPYVSSENHSFSVGLEGGIGNLFEIGADLTTTKTEITSGPWGGCYRKFAANTSGSVYENVYLRQGGELAIFDDEYSRQIGGDRILQPYNVTHLDSIKIHSNERRDARGNLIYYFTASEASQTGIGSNPFIVNYTSTDGFASGAVTTKQNIERVNSGSLGRKSDHLSEIVQIQKDGRRYIYDIPAMNNIQKEVTMSVNGGSTGYSSDGMVGFSGSDDGPGNTKGMDNFHSSTITPSYAHSFLLTSVLSTDYVDITGNGISDDDLGSYTKFNYSLKEKDYRWRAPYQSGKAQYNPGFRSDTRDDKGSYIIGSREEWMLHSIETRNFIAEFYTSARYDACGSSDAIVTSGDYAIAPYNATSGHAPSYKLDSIKLFNKHDRFINAANATPIKTVYFAYTDTLCMGIPNSLGGFGGKLTLNRIYFKYGSSQKSMISPYQFNYGFNPSYSYMGKDRWGNYKAPGGGNFEFPFINQGDPNNDLFASAWSLNKITLPSGGVIEAQYEADDYAYVQDKEANEMFRIEGIGNTPRFDTSSLLYPDKHSPNLFFYFKRRPGDERALTPLTANYFDSSDLLYYCFRVKMRGDKTLYEQIKGYTYIDDIGFCDDGIHGYVKVKPVNPEGAADIRLNPVTYTAINTGRYNIPQVMYPGSEPDWDILHAIGNMFGNFAELGSLFQNPTNRFVNHHAAQKADRGLSFIRLKSPGLRKKGGGQRIKSLLFYDSWNKLSGGNEQNATYGKKYDYRLEDGTSSGVASYEPLVGGDENPLRQPAPYEAMNGRHWPPMDPVDQYQELPLGESLYPPATVGYSKVTVSSIHEDIGRSSQGVDVYKFYTAKDFPIFSKASGLSSSKEDLINFFLQENTMEATQGFTLVMNDMHGKPMSIEHYVKKPRTNALTRISLQEYHYKHTGNKLDNHVKCLVWDAATSSMKCVTQQVGIDPDITIDSREKDETTRSNTFNMNLNVSYMIVAVIPIPFAFPWHGKYHTRFRSATVTKVIQQYGILDNIKTDNEGAVVVQQNELYDPISGQPVVTSVTNEYANKEYSATVPAYWAYTAMGPAYQNIKYEGDIARLKIDSTHVGRIFWPDANLKVGDELIFSYTDSNTGGYYTNKVWFIGAAFVPETEIPYPHYDSIKGEMCLSCTAIIPEHCEGSVLPRFPLNTPGWDTAHVLKGIHFKVVRSGNRNMLTSVAETYTQMDNPAPDDVLQLTGDYKISDKAITYCDSNTVVPFRYLSNADTVNPFVIGQRGIYRPLGEYSYVTQRDGGDRPGYEGVFKGTNFYSLSYDNSCIRFPYSYLVPDVNLTNDPKWKLMRTITKWSPFGLEIENKDATGVYSSAVFGYNEDLPVAVAANAKQGEVMADGFEDYSLLHLISDPMNFGYSCIRPLFNGTTSLGTSTMYNSLLLSVPNDIRITTDAAHTGNYSLYVPSLGGSDYYNIPVAVDTNTYPAFNTFYNSYYDPLAYFFNGKNEYKPFRITPGKRYIASFWIRSADQSVDYTDYSISSSCGMYTDISTYLPVKRSDIINGWQQLEVTFTSSTTANLYLPANYYIDDLRIFPADANIKSFVYNPVNEKLMATLDENNFAKMYEYDQEGNLVRVKKETEKGIMTVSESRSNNPSN
jgi:hypothetical protein